MKRIKFSIGLFLIILGIIFIIAYGSSKYSKEEALAMGLVSERVLIPGGASIGIQMEVKGALIVGTEWDFGPEIGDMIVEVGGKKVESAKDVQNIVCKNKDEVEVVVRRGKRNITYKTCPRYNKEEKAYRLGLWVKEKIAGIGTLSFYDPLTGKYAALGHGIYERETDTLLDVKEGQLLETEVNSITEGEKGTPGEIGGMIYNCTRPIGDINLNSVHGIYGNSSEKLMNVNLNTPMIMAYQDQITEGKATILTTIDGREVEEFSIEITKVNRQKKAEEKGIEFRVIDEELIKRCGGIVQGMSGSPIIQNNRIIGAVTHVLIDEPLEGYGIFAQWMVEEIDFVENVAN